MDKNTLIDSGRKVLVRAKGIEIRNVQAKTLKQVIIWDPPLKDDLFSCTSKNKAPDKNQLFSFSTSK
jgi:hypothetical protein